MSQTTKKALAASLKKLLKKKPLDKVTVIDIAEDCGVNRQTFYYHFKDIYDLIEWIYLSEALQALDGNKTYDTWRDGFLHIFKYVLDNREFVLSTYHSVSREYLERYLYNEVYNLLIGVVEEKADGMNVRDEDKKFIADFYKFAFVGIVLEWIGQGMKAEPKSIVEKVNTLIYGDFSKALNKFRTDGKTGSRA